MLSAFCQIFKELRGGENHWKSFAEEMEGGIHQGSYTQKKKLLTLAKKLQCMKLKYRYCPHGKNVGKVFRQMVKTWPYSAFYYSTLCRSPYRNVLEKDKELKSLWLLQADVPLHVVVRQWSLR